MLYYYFRCKNIILRRFLVIILLFCVAFYVLLTIKVQMTDLEGDFRFGRHQRHRSNSPNISCHYDDTNDALLPIEDYSRIPSKSIFFHETSCRGRLNSRQACSVESAARAHPDWQIIVLFSGPVTKENLNSYGILYCLNQYVNIKYFRLHLLEYAKGTPVEDFVSGGALNQSFWPIFHTADFLRLLTLSKWGGVSLDFDQLVVKSFDVLGNNWVVRKSNKTLASSPLSISKNLLGSMVVNAALSDFKTYYKKENKWSYGSKVLTKSLQKICNTLNVHKMTAVRCRGFEVLSTELFFPVSEVKRYFAHKKLTVEYPNPYVHHMFNLKTARYNLTPNSVYAKLARQYCPAIHDLYGNKFGL